MRYSPLLLCLVLFVLGCGGENPKLVEQIVYETTPSIITLKFEIDKEELKRVERELAAIQLINDPRSFNYIFSQDEIDLLNKFELYHRIKDFPYPGSGFIISEDGEFVTCAHVIDTIKDIPGKLYAVFYNYNQYEIEYVDSYPLDDIAIGKLVNVDKKFPALKIELDRQIHRSERIMVFGTSGTVWKGFLEGRIIWPYKDMDYGKIQQTDSSEYQENIISVIQMSTPVRPGWSGGPVLNMYGNVIGITSLMSSDGVHSYAIPIINKFSLDRTEKFYDAGRGDAS